MKDDALAPLNCVVTMHPLPRPEVSDNQVPSSPVVFEGKVDIPESFEDDLLDNCDNVAVPIAAASPFITTGQRFRLPLVWVLRHPSTPPSYQILRFKQDRNNEHEASHFYNFVGPSIRIHQFSVLSPFRKCSIVGTSANQAQ
nr:hypothetical protein CFP56_64504 [Quercus suber]